MAMGQMISPGVYTNIIDLSEYLADIPGTIGFIPILSKRGPDNKLMFVDSKEKFIDLYGEPNIMDYEKYFGQGPYIAWQHLGVSSHLYVLRALPSDATYSHVVIGMQIEEYILNGQYSSSSVGIPFERLAMQPLYMDGKNHPYGGISGKLNYTVGGGGSITVTSINNAGSGYIAGSHIFDVPNGIGGKLNYTVSGGGTITAASVNTGGSEYTPGSYTIIVYSYPDNPYPTINVVQELRTLFKGIYADDTSMFMNPELTGGVGVPNGILMYFRGIGRGGSYNDFAIQISRFSNPEMFGIYVVDIYETQTDGDDIIIESFNVSFDPNAVDDAGESLFIEDVINKFSKDIRCQVNRDALRRLFADSGDGESWMMKFYKNDPTLPEWVTEYTVLDDHGQKTDLGFKATVIEFAKMDYDYTTFMLNEALGVLADARDLPTDTAEHIIARNEAITAALVEVSAARSAVSTTSQTLQDAYALDIMDFGDADPYTAGEQPWHLREGTEGALVYTEENTGKLKVQTTEARQVLAEAYLGLLQKADNPPKIDPTSGDEKWKPQYVDEVFDLDWIYFSLVYDAGYDGDVKDAALTLVNVYRRDCMLISDCGDNIDYEDLEAAVGGNPAEPSGRLWNSRYAARYEPYSRVYDVFTGRDLWLSPVYHMAQLIPLNDRLYEIWYASAGFNRGTLDSIKELRWSAKLGERDKLYLMQINPIVHFPEGYTVWGNLTTQKRPTALQDINVMRLVLYIKRALEQFCRYFIFEFNDQITWDRIKQGIIPFLDTIRARRGLVDYSIEVGATEWEFKNKICHVNVTLTPMKVIEKIELNLYVK